ncbi:MAG: 4'-phosphopantetheinyl transferase superfamily protein [Chloroflexaceae bacterium]|nr:4'-phosphopantetheinyl transferase superfamily protein [Chloroflexaceae bacterium]
MTMSFPGWETPASWPQLSDDDVHIWLITLTVPHPPLPMLWPLLDADEQRRANQFRSPRDGARFAVAHAALRAILAGYLSLEPAAVRFVRHGSAKPALDPGMSADLRFNFTHSHDLALCALSRNREVGIDIEQVQPQVPFEAIATTFFSDREQLALASLPPAQRSRGFYRCWTRKEAFVKALGVGLSLPLRSFDVTPLPGAPAALVDSPSLTDGHTIWTICDVPLSDGYVAALAVEGSACRLRHWRWGWASR